MKKLMILLLLLSPLYSYAGTAVVGTHHKQIDNTLYFADDIEAANFEGISTIGLSSGGGTPSLQNSYEGGADITTDVGNGPLSITDGGSGVLLNLPTFSVTSGSVTFKSNIAVFQDIKAAGSQAGACSAGNYITRDINTATTPASFANLTGTSKILIQPGWYFVDALVFASKSDRHRAKFINSENLDDLVLGKSSWTESTNNDSTESPIFGRFTTSVPIFTRIVHRCSVASDATDWGAALNWGEDEVYTTITIRKEK